MLVSPAFSRLLAEQELDEDEDSASAMVDAAPRQPSTLEMLQVLHPEMREVGQKDQPRSYLGQALAFVSSQMDLVVSSVSVSLHSWRAMAVNGLIISQSDGRAPAELEEETTLECSPATLRPLILATTIFATCALSTRGRIRFIPLATGAGLLASVLMEAAGLACLRSHAALWMRADEFVKKAEKTCRRLGAASSGITLSRTRASKTDSHLLADSTDTTHQHAENMAGRAPNAWSTADPKDQQRAQEASKALKRALAGSAHAFAQVLTSLARECKQGEERPLLHDQHLSPENYHSKLPASRAQRRAEAVGAETALSVLREHLSDLQQLRAETYRELITVRFEGGLWGSARRVCSEVRALMALSAASAQLRAAEQAAAAVLREEQEQKEEEEDGGEERGGRPLGWALSCLEEAMRASG